ncbi:MAG: hypothetical protein EG828_03835 [Deltaproteobacteria bacterium]|nr:hypothetical protein [Deltaproteobacteria bacterium]
MPNDAKQSKHAASRELQDIVRPAMAETVRYRCRGKHVVAILLTVAGGLFAGTNGIAVPQEECPRKARGCRRGEGWDLCREICGQSGHAEANAIRAAGARAIGGTLLLFGHDTVCEDCVTLMRQAGIDRYIVMPDACGKEGVEVPVSANSLM